VKVMAILRAPDTPDLRAELARQAREEFGALWQLYRDGVVREMYSPGRPGAVLILECESVRAATELLHALPLVASRTVTVELIELQPFRAFEMLFASRP
jgi:uncharacterized protein (DUF1330 family)